MVVGTAGCGGSGSIPAARVAGGTGATTPAASAAGSGSSGSGSGSSNGGGTGSAASPAPVAPSAPAAPAAKAYYFDQTITSHDGIPLVATVYVPPLAPGQTAPLILHGNGWADRRTRAPVDITRQPTNFYGDMHGGMVTRMWQEGYVVMTLDQRGWGDSGGQIRITDPDLEVRDFRTLIDWAEKNLPVTKDATGALVGAVGGSYGGGFQIMLAKQDPRVRAVSPWVSWHDLRYSLAPNNVMRTGHVSLLHLGGQVYGHMDPFIPRAYASAATLNTVPDDVNAILKHHSPIEFCEQGTAPKVDALIVQGTRDTLFDIAEGWQNALCLKATGADVRFLGVPNGHLFTEQDIQTAPTSSACGSVDPFDSVVAWYAEKLKKIPNAAARVPKVCMPLTDTTNVTMDTLPVGGEKLTVPATTVTWTPGNVHNDGMQFVPLKTLAAPATLAGVPLSHLSLDSTVPGADPIVFVGFAVRHPDGSSALIDDQIAPLRGVKTFEQWLPGISAPLAAGDVLGLALYTSHGQFADNASRVPFTVAVKGTVEVPLS